MTLQITILSADGGVLAACINAATLALQRGGVALTDVPTAASVAYLEEKCLVDPTAAEANAGDAEMTLAILERAASISALLCDSKVSQEVYFQLINAATIRCGQIVSILREAASHELTKRVIMGAYVSNRIGSAQKLAASE